MKFLSVCSGIEAASVAWTPLGWKACAFSEIEPFPCSVLAHHYPDTPNLGDMTKFKDWPDASIDLLCGGTPCQSFSVAGLRKGLDDPRGNLMLTFGAIAGKYRPRWLVWENVPGVLSSNGGRDFGTFLGMLGQLGYGFAYRVLDAQHFGVPQRRRRVFVVGCLGDWRSAAAVLFERHSLQGHPAPRREAREVAPTIPSRSTGGGGLGTDFDCDGGLIPQAFGGGNTAGPIDVSTCLTHHGNRQDFDSETFVAHSLRGEGFDASEDGTGRGTPLVPVAFQSWASACNSMNPSACAPTLDKGKCEGTSVAVGMQVRRLTPTECEAIQGFPRNYTRIPVRTYKRRRITRLRPADMWQENGDGTWTLMAADGPRYKAIGNSWAVPVVRWIGRRIEAVDALRTNAPEAAA